MDDQNTNPVDPALETEEDMENETPVMPEDEEDTEEAEDADGEFSE